MKTFKEFKKDFKKEKIRKSLGKEIRYHLTQSLDHAIEFLRGLRNQYDSEYDELKLEIEADDYGYGDGAYVSITLFGTRLETDEEFINRTEREYRRYQDQWDRDRKTYERMKKIFEDDKAE